MACPFCGSKNTHDATDFLIKELRSASILEICVDCDNFVGKCT